MNKPKVYSTTAQASQSEGLYLNSAKARSEGPYWNIEQASQSEGPYLNSAQASQSGGTYLNSASIGEFRTHMTKVANSNVFPTLSALLIFQRALSYSGPAAHSQVKNI